MGRQGFLAALAAALLTVPGAAAAQKCTLGKVGEFPITMSGFQPMTAAKINGIDVQLMVDSGAFYSSLDASSRERFGLKKGALPPNMTIRGVGGAASFGVGKADKFEVGDFDLSNVEFLVGGPTFGSRAAGILGANILAATDIEYDLANGMVRMFKPDGCEKANLAYWAGDKPYSIVPMQSVGEGGKHILGSAKVNGQTIRVVFDTGASTSVLKRSTAERLGFKPDAPGVVAGGLSGGIGRSIAETWIAPFASFEIGGEKISNTKLRVATINLPNADMLLGADFFLSHRVFVSWSGKRVFITYNGGPVFRLERTDVPGPRGPLAAAAVAKATAAESQPGDPTDADGYSRRAAASVARRDFVAAITDLTRAIEMQPGEPNYHFQRAAAHQAARQPLMAIADYDETLKLKPDHVLALVNRGEMFLNNRNVARAKVDFDAAIKVADSADTVGVRIAMDYLRAGLADDAIAELDAWIGAHPRDERNPGILNGRCYARALANKQLDLAMADCNAAVRFSANSSSLESRGLVYFRMGQLDKAVADYEDALKRQPRAPGPMYGRGLARVKQGKLAEGRADMQAALALDPTLAQRAQRYGLTE